MHIHYFVIRIKLARIAFWTHKMSKLNIDFVRLKVNKINHNLRQSDARTPFRSTCDLTNCQPLKSESVIAFASIRCDSMQTRAELHIC